MRRYLHTILAAAVGLVVLHAGVLAYAQDAASAAPAKVSTAAQLGFSLYELMAPLLALLVTWLSARLSAYLKANTKNQLVAGALVRANEAIAAAVKMVNQTLRAGIEAAKDPKSDGGTAITKAEADQLKNAVWDALKAEYGGMDGLKKALGVLGLDEAGLLSWVNTRIEAAVHDVGAAKAAGGGSAPLR